MTARLDNKYINISDFWLANYFLSDSEENYILVAGYRIPDKGWMKCEIGVSRDTYYSISRRDKFQIVYDQVSPSKCSLSDGIEISRTLLFVTVVFAIFLLILGIVFIIYIYKSFRILQPGDSVELTTFINLGENEPKCPKCYKIMIEGYMPTVGGVSWRDRNEPIGIPTIFNGLPGTTFWIKRPLLHAFRCKDCKVIIFKYGKFRD